MNPCRTLLILPLLLVTPLQAQSVDGESRTHHVVNERNHHTFDSAHPVEATVRPGDRIVTKTVDSAGWDYQNIRRTERHGNPLTGPFYVEGAEPGDALVVHLERVRLNRTWGYTSDRINAYALTDEYLDTESYPPLYDEPMILGGPENFLEGRTNLVPWVIDPERNTVRMREPVSERIVLEFPAHPFLGAIGVPPIGEPPTSGPAGHWGGNMDYKEIREGVTLYIPVYRKGGLLMFGDGHAAQGDGEALGSGVETSLDVTLQVDLLKGAGLNNLRLENEEYLISIGAASGSTLNDALKIATTDMVRWLVNDYGLEPWAAHQLIGVAGEYDIAAIAGTVGCKIPKALLGRRPQAR